MTLDRGVSPGEQGSLSKVKCAKITGDGVAAVEDDEQLVP